MGVDGVGVTGGFSASEAGVAATLVEFFLTCFYGGISSASVVEHCVKYLWFTFFLAFRIRFVCRLRCGRSVVGASTPIRCSWRWTLGRRHIVALLRCTHLQWLLLGRWLLAHRRLSLRTLRPVTIRHASPPLCSIRLTLYCLHLLLGIILSRECGVRAWWRAHAVDLSEQLRSLHWVEGHRCRRPSHASIRQG